MILLLCSESGVFKDLDSLDVVSKAKKYTFKIFAQLINII